MNLLGGQGTVPEHNRSPADGDVVDAEFGRLLFVVRGRLRLFLQQVGKIVGIPGAAHDGNGRRNKFQAGNDGCSPVDGSGTE